MATFIFYAMLLLIGAAATKSNGRVESTVMRTKRTEKASLDHTNAGGLPANGKMQVSVSAEDAVVSSFDQQPQLGVNLHSLQQQLAEQANEIAELKKNQAIFADQTKELAMLKAKMAEPLSSGLPASLVGKKVTIKGAEKNGNLGNNGQPLKFGVSIGDFSDTYDHFEIEEAGTIGGTTVYSIQTLFSRHGREMEGPYLGMCKGTSVGGARVDLLNHVSGCQKFVIEQSGSYYSIRGADCNNGNSGTNCGWYLKMCGDASNDHGKIQPSQHLGNCEKWVIAAA